MKRVHPVVNVSYLHKADDLGTFGRADEPPPVMVTGDGNYSQPKSIPQVAPPQEEGPRVPRVVGWLRHGGEREKEETERERKREKRGGRKRERRERERESRERYVYAHANPGAMKMLKSGWNEKKKERRGKSNGHARRSSSLTSTSASGLIPSPMAKGPNRSLAEMRL
jgi:hypothetical protein